MDWAGVTGGSSCIGRVTAVALVKEEAKIAIAGRREKEGEETVPIHQRSLEVTVCLLGQMLRMKMMLKH